MNNNQSDWKHKIEFTTPVSKLKQPINAMETYQHSNPEEAHQNYLISNFHGETRYSLNYLNSIYYRNGKIYNLLERNTDKKTIKCRCVKSFCEAKYCECFRNGQACGEQCNCQSCKNRNPHKVQNHALSMGCKCKKSGCSKKYCQCFQNGKKCGPHCQCVNCCNSG